ncbi:MAG: ABC transporter substrate-binding protein [Anaerolineaceae bacterium]
MTKHVISILCCAVLLMSVFLSGCQVQNSQANSGSFAGLSISAADCSYGGEIRSVAATDQNTVVFTLCRPDAAFLAKIAHPIFAVQDRETLNQAGGSSKALSDSINGEGAFRLKSYTPGKEAVLVPSTSYWGLPPKPQTITLRWVNDPITRYHEFQNNNGDVLIDPPSGLIMIIRESEGLNEISKIGLNTIFLGINNKVQPFDNVKVRQALAQIVNRQYIASNYLVQGSETADQLIPSRISPGYSDSIPWYSTDSNAAKALLQEAGFDFNQRLTLAYPSQGVPGVDTTSVIAQELKSELASIGVTLDLKRLSEAELRSAIAAGSEQLYLSWLAADYPDGLAFYEKAFIHGADTVGGYYPELVAAVRELQAVTSAGGRQLVFDKANQMVKDLVPFIPLGHSLTSVFVRNTVSNLSTNGLFQNYASASVQSGEILVYLGDEPKSFWPADETDASTFTLTRLLYDTLAAPSMDGKSFDPLLAESWESNQDLTQWTFHLRYDVRFSNSARFDANDVVASFSAIWDRSDPNHKGRTGEFSVFQDLFGHFIN